MTSGEAAMLAPCVIKPCWRIKCKAPLEEDVIYTKEKRPETKKTPKEILADEILKAVGKFEVNTGAEVYDIRFPERLNNTEFKDILESSCITKIEFDMS